MKPVSHSILAKLKKAWPKILALLLLASSLQLVQPQFANAYMSKNLTVKTQFYFSGTQGQTLNFWTDSSVDALLYIYDYSSGSGVAINVYSDDRSNGTGNSLDAWITWTVPSNGTYGLFAGLCCEIPQTAGDSLRAAIKYYVNSDVSLTTSTTDTTPPSVSTFNSTSLSPNSGSTFNYSLTFNEAITGLAAADFENAGTSTGCSFSPNGSNGTTFTITISSCSEGGTLQPRLKANSVVDSASNTGPTTAATASRTIAIDRTAPSAPSAPDLASSSDNGTSSTDDLTSQTSLTFTGTAELNSSVQLYVNENSAGSSCTANGGNYSCSLTSSVGTLSVTAKATDAAGNVSLASSAITINVVTALTISGLSITGTVRSGQSLSYNLGTTGGTPTAFSYKWQSAQTLAGTYSDIVGATSETYTVNANDVNQYLRLIITASKTGFTASITSASVGPALDIAPTVTSASISGVKQVGDTLAAIASGVTGANITTSYQWQRASTSNGAYSNISAATASTYVLNSADESQFIKVIISITNSGGSVSATSSATIAIAPILLTVSTPSNVSGTAGIIITPFSVVTLNGNSVKAFSVYSGRLPGGIFLNTSTGAISGTPVESGNYSVVIEVTDGTTTVRTNAFSFALTTANGLSMFIKNEAGATTAITRSEFFIGCQVGLSTLINYSWGSGAPSISGSAVTSSGSCNVDGVTVYAKGGIKAPITGVVTYCVVADDGAFVRINYATIINNWVDQGPNSNCNATGTMNMVLNTVYPIALWFHENAGGAAFSLSWSYAGQTRIPVPASAFTTSAPTLSIITPGNSVATKGVSYSLQVVAVGGAAIKTFTLADGSGPIPAGLTLDSSTGLISGTPTTAQTYSFTVRVTDSEASTVTTNSFTISVGSVPNSPGTPTVGGPVTGDGRLKATWTAPTDLGNNAITNYEIRYAIANVLSWSAWSSVNTINGNSAADTATVLSGLGNAKNYVVQVRAVNTVGFGGASESSLSGTSSGNPPPGLGAPLNSTVTSDSEKLTIAFTPNLAAPAIAFTNLAEVCTNESNWIVRSNVRYAHQFTAGSATVLSKAEFRLGAGLQQYPSQIKIVIYANGAGDVVGAKLGELTYSSVASNISIYTGSVNIPSAGTYWVEQQPTAAIANHYYCGTASANATGSASGWLPNKGKVANGSDSLSWSYFAGAPYNYPMFRLTGSGADDPNSAISDYQYSLDGGATWKSISASLIPSPATIAITGLTNGTLYDVRIRAVNGAGPGAAATPTGIARPGKAPTVPNNVVLGQNVGEITVNFAAPSDTGGLTTSYQYRIKTGENTGGNPSYYPAGPTANVPVTTVTSGGWSLCWSGDMAGIDLLTNILNSCTGKYIMYAGGLKANANYLLLAAGERSSVFKETGANLTTANNGSYWYYRTVSSASMGFAPTATIQQSSADVFDRASTLRMSWHTAYCGAGKICGGWRVGSFTGLNGSTTYVRAIYQSNGGSGGADSEWGAWIDADTSTAMVIPGIINDKKYTVQIRAKNAIGFSDPTVAQVIDTNRPTGPTITTQPIAQNLTLNQTSGFTLSVVATKAKEAEVLTYKWYKDNIAIDTATASTYVVSGPILSLGIAGSYKVIVTSTLNGIPATTQSDMVTVTVNGVPVIKTSPVPNNGTVGAPYSFDLGLNAGTGTAPLTWTLAPGSSLPPGLSLTTGGRIVGTPTVSTASASAGATTVGSLSLNGSSSYLSAPASSDWATATGNFTVEWWQYQTDSSAAPRVFSVGTANTPALAVSLESGNFYGWVAGTKYLLGPLGTYKNTWVHFAFVREGTTLKAFKDGVLIGSSAGIAGSVNDSSDALLIGSAAVAGTYFGGNITNFHFVKGSALYSSTFIRTTSISATANTKLLLLASTAGSFLIDSSGVGKSMSNTGVSHSTTTASSGSTAKDTLQNANFGSPLTTDATKGWAQTVRPGGNAVIANNGLIMSFGAQACTSQSTVRLGEVQQKVVISRPGTVTFTVKVDATLWNRVGAGYSNPCHDPYQVTLSSSSGTTAFPSASTRAFSTQMNAALAAADPIVNATVTVSLVTTSANEEVTITLAGLDSGYWGGNYGPRFYEASLTVPGGGAIGASKVIVSDANGRTAESTFTIEISPEISITTKSLPNAANSAPYSQSLTVSGGSGIYEWAIDGDASTALPTGLTLNISGVLAGNVGASATSKSFRVKATDSNGAIAYQNLSITVANGVPDAPTSLTVGTLSSQTIPLTWVAPARDGGTAISQYIINFSAPKGTDPADTDEIDQGSVTVSGSLLAYSLTGIKNGRTYAITVSAKNTGALGNPSNTVTAKPVTAASAPNNLSVVLANGGITIGWKVPDSYGGLTLTSWKVQCQVPGAESWITIDATRVNTSDGGVLSVIGLSPPLVLGSAYVCRVAAVTSTGDGAFITSSTPLIFATPPAAPTINGTPNTATPGIIRVVWNKSIATGGATITSYIATVIRDLGAATEIRRSCSVARPTDTATATTWDSQSTFTCDILSVPKKAVLTLSVVAVNSVGSSQETTSSITLTGTTQTLTVSSLTQNKNLGVADFSLNATSDSGLSPQYSVPNANALICEVTSRSLIKLKIAGTCVVKINQNGRDAAGVDTEFAVATELTVTITVADRIPGTPRFSTVTSGNGTLTITWLAPSNSGGVPDVYVFETGTVTSGTTTWSSEILTTNTEEASATKTIASLVNGTEYKLRIAARNSGGTSDWVEAPTLYVPFTVPVKPAITSITPTAFNGSSVVSWSAPNTQGSALTGYLVTASAAGKTDRSCSVGGSATSCTINSLDNKVEYSYRLIARNSAGNSAVSDAYVSTVPGISQTINLATTPASDGWIVGDPNLQILASATSGLTLSFASSNSAICEVTTNSGSLRFVSAGNCAITISQSGENSRYLAASSVVLNFTVAPAVPSAPNITSAVSSLSGIEVTWTVPTRTGASLTGYVVTATAAGKTTVIAETSNTTTILSTGIEKATLYTITVYAKNVAGDGAVSIGRSAIWYASPDAPVLSSAAASGSDGRAIDVSFVKSIADGGTSVLRYIATATGGPANKSCIVASTGDASQSCVIRDLRAGVSYSVSIIAVNAAGQSLSSNSISVTPGITQVLTVSSPATTLTVNYGASDIRVIANINSGNMPIFNTDAASVCAVGSSGLVNFGIVGSCTITISHPGSTDVAESVYKASNTVTISVTVAAVVPSLPRITGVSVGDGSMTIFYTGSSFNGGATISNTATVGAGSCAAVGSTFQCTGLTNGTPYSAVIRATNSAGSTDSNSVSGTPYSNAKAPLPLLVTASDRQATLNWTDPTDNGGLSISTFEIYSRILNTGSWAKIGETTAGVRSFTATSLSIDTQYEFQVRATTLSADPTPVPVLGEFTESVIVKTFALPDAPNLVRATANGTSVAITWNAPTSNGGGAILGYTARVVSGAVTQTCTTSSTVFTCTISGLTAALNFTVSVKATTSVGDSAWADAPTTVLTYGKPGATTSVAVTSNANTGSATITWNTPESNGGSSITSYIARAFLGTLESSTPLTCTAAHVSGTGSYSCTITGLSYKVAYIFAVRAINIASPSDLSATSDTQTLVRAQEITFASLGDPITFATRSLILTGTTSSGLAITYISSPSSVCAVAAGSSVLSINSIGTCTVTATQNGEGTAFSAATPVINTLEISAIQPGAISLLQVIPGASRLSATWSAATDFGGAASASYIISWATNPDFSDEQSAQTLSTAFTITDLDPQVTYSVRIRVVTPNYAKGSAWSNLIQGTTLGLPAAPSTITVTTGAGTAEVAWTNVSPLNNGGTPIIGYRAEARLGAGLTPITCQTASDSCVITGLDGSKFYFFQVVAINAVGESKALEDPTDRRPGAEQLTTATDKTVSHAIGQFSIGATNSVGLPLTYSVVSNTPTTTVSGRTVCAVNVTTGVVSVDLAGTCVIKISQDGKDSGGNASPYFPANDVLITITVTASAPTNVVDFSVSSADSALEVSWNKPVDDGGSPIIKYEISWYRISNIATLDENSDSAISDAELDTYLATSRVAATSGRVVILNPDTLSYKIEGLVNGVEYRVIVHSFNFASRSPRS